MSYKKQKGNKLEDYVADQIINKGLDTRARRDPPSGAGNREKADIFTSLQIMGQNVGIECKNQKTLAIPQWWKQTAKLDLVGREPILVFKLHREPLEDALAVIRLNTLLDLIKYQRSNKNIEEIFNISNYEKKKMKNELKQFKRLLTKLEDYL